jgi:hypothetical protein
MKQLELQQEREERELVDRAAIVAAGGTPSSAAPIRSRSGNDLTAFGSADEGEVKEKKRVDYANAKSMPGSRRHSGEFKEDGTGSEGLRRKTREGEPMLNNFLFDDELDADLQSECSPPSATKWSDRCVADSAWGGKYLQMNTDDDKFPILIRRDSYPGIVSARPCPCLDLTDKVTCSSPRLLPPSTSLPSRKPPPTPTATLVDLVVLERLNGPSSRAPPPPLDQATLPMPLPTEQSTAQNDTAPLRTADRPSRLRRQDVRRRGLRGEPVLDSSLPRGARSRPLEE